MTNGSLGPGLSPQERGSCKGCCDRSACITLMSFQMEVLVPIPLVRLHQKATALHQALNTEEQRVWRVRTTTTKVKHDGM